MRKKFKRQPVIRPKSDSFYGYGFGLGAFFIVAIIITNIVYPNLGSEDPLSNILGFGSIFVYIAYASYLVTKKTQNRSIGIRVGCFTALIGFAIAMISFFVVDNLFLSIVSQQADKIWGFEHSNFASMQAYINSGLLRGLLFGIPLSGIFGIVAGATGSVMSPRSSSRH